MVNNPSSKNTTKQESLYGWYPGKIESPRGDPKEIYIKLGSRPPRNQSYCDADILYNYHKSITPSELIYKPKETVESALKPPWSLHISRNVELDENAAKTIPEALQRSQSAPPVRAAPNHRIVLKIPSPNMQNLFTEEDEEEFNNNNNNNNNNNQEANNANVSDDADNLNAQLINAINVYEAFQANDEASTKNEINKSKITINDEFKKICGTLNNGKKSLVFEEPPKTNHIRPKTVSVSLNRSNSVNSVKSSVKDRPKTSNINSKLVSKSLTDKYHIEPLNTDNSNRSINNNENSFNGIIHGRSSPINVTHGKSSPMNGGRSSPVNGIIPTPTLHDTHRSINFSAQQNIHNQSNNQRESTAVYTEPAWLDNYASSRNKLRTDIQILEGNWKDQIINRNKYLYKRPKYFVKINLDKIKPDPAPPEIHYKASETFYYNTLPHRRMTFSIDPNFISENLNVKKVALQNRPLSSGPVRYRRDYAFVY